MNPVYDNADHPDYKEVINGEAATDWHGFHAVDFCAVDERMGVYMGVFNLFIVIPQAAMSLAVPVIYARVLGGDPLHVVMLGGVSLLVAAAATLLVEDVGVKRAQATNA